MRRVTGHALLDRLADPFFAVDDRWRFTYLNDRAEQLFDRQKADLLGRVIWDEFPETVETQFPDGFYQAMDAQDPVAFEVYHSPLDTWFEARAFPSEGGLSVYLQDVTTSKQRRKDLTRYEAIVEAAHDGVITIDTQNRVTFANTAVERTLGVDRDALVGEHVEKVFEYAETAPDQLGELGHALDSLRAGHDSVRQFELSYTDTVGRTRVAETRMVPLHDGTASVAGVVRDITDRHEHERVITSLHDVTRRLFDARDHVDICAVVVNATSELLDLPISGVWLLDDEMGRLDPIAGSAGAYDELGGLPRFQEGDGLIWDAFRKDRAVLYDDVAEHGDVYDPETPIRSEIIVPLGSHGVLMTGSTTADAFDETDLELVSTLGANAEAALDRADRESLLRERKQVLARQSERLDAVSHVISRDVRERIEDARRTVDGTPAEKLGQADELLDDVLEFAGGRASVGPRSGVTLCDVVRSAASEAGVSVAVDVAEATSLRADEERLTRMFVSLFESAAERAGPDVDVTVALVTEDPATPSLGMDGRFGGGDGRRGFEVTDDGPGIPPKSTDGVFRVGYDASETSAGLSLPVAREIAEAHGWRIEVDDEYEAGTRVVVDGVTTLEPGR